MKNQTVFAIRRKSDGAFLFMDEDGNESWCQITTWEENDLVLEDGQEIVKIEEEETI